MKPRLVQKFPRRLRLCGCRVNGWLRVCQSSHAALYFVFLLLFFPNADLGPTSVFGSECLSGRTFALPAAANVAKPTIVILSCRINSRSGESWKKKKKGEKCFG